MARTSHVLPAPKCLSLRAGPSSIGLEWGNATGIRVGFPTGVTGSKGGQRVAHFAKGATFALQADLLPAGLARRNASNSRRYLAVLSLSAGRHTP